MSKIIRSKRKTPFVQIDKRGLEDKRLSWKAKGILAYLLCMPDDWQVYISEIKNHSKDGRDSTTSGINELMKFGYIERERTHEKGTGKFTGYDYRVIEFPSDSGKPENGESVDGKSENDNPENGKPVTTDKDNTDIEFTDIEDTDKEEHADKFAPPVSDEPEKKDTPKSGPQKNKKVAPGTKKIVGKGVSKEKAEIHLAMDKMNERYPEWCKVRGIDANDKIDFSAKECGQLNSLLKKIKGVLKQKKIHYKTNSEFINGAFSDFLTAYIAITKAYQGKNAGWYTSSFKPSQMVGNYQDIRDTYKLIRNNNQNGSNTTVTNEFKQRQYDILNRAKQQAAYTG